MEESNRCYRQINELSHLDEKSKWKRTIAKETWSALLSEVVFLRVWHWELIPVLPRQQLLGQWRELCLIARNLSERGTPNHILVNPVKDYPLKHLDSYANLVYHEMRDRGYFTDWHNYSKYRGKQVLDCSLEKEALFPGWHNDRYYWQCYHNLQEKYDRGGMTDEEWRPIEVMTQYLYGDY